MTNPLGTYSFLPWLRQGISRTIKAKDEDAGVKTRASIEVGLTLHGDPVGAAVADVPIERPVQLYGPGDIVGIEASAIVRTEPRDWITNFEPNYLAQIEFYDEDFAWRYTPAAPDQAGLKLRPWIALIVLKDDEFDEGKNMLGKPLPYIDVKNAAALPPAGELWAWAHVHVNRSLAASEAEFVSTDGGAVASRLQAVLDENRDLAYSRLICPRKLDENTSYHAFVVPVFETGRLAGLGYEPDAAPHATFSAWGTYTGKQDAPSLPVYHRWQFRTSTQGDFESLVRLLQPRPVDPRVGIREIDVLEPGSDLPGITEPDLHGVLRLGGALRVPAESLSPQERTEAERYEHWAQPYPRPFQEKLAAFLDLADDYAARSVEAANDAAGLGEDPDPVVTPPIYARWHALAERVLRERNGHAVPHDHDWLHELNLDPRHRVAAAFGTRVIQENQEDLMDAAWAQVGDVLEANRRIRLAQLAKQVATIWYDRHLVPLARRDPERALTLMAPVQGRVLADGATIAYQRQQSRVQPVLTSVAMRRATRPGTPLSKALTTTAGSPQTLLEEVNSGAASAAPPMQAPGALTSVDELAEALEPPAPAGLDAALRRAPWLPYAVLAVGLVIALLLLLLLGGLGIVLAIAVALLALALFAWLTRLRRKLQQVDVIREENQTPAAVEELPHSSDFHLSEPGSGFRPTFDGADSVQAGRFKQALQDWATLAQATGTVSKRPEPVQLDLSALTGTAVAAVEPSKTIPTRILGTIEVPPRISEELDESFQEVMAYPVIETPMYKPLSEISSELFLPNVNLVQENSITLLENNRPFIEAYMAGLNHEFARELLWREYPTDQRGSYFRQFWDVRSLFTAGPPTEAQRESMRDIAELHRWVRGTALGTHPPSQDQAVGEDKVVLVIRGELLKKYPTAVIYAHRAKWQLGKGGKIDPAKERELDDLSPSEEADPPLAKVRTPLYEAKLEPDVYFFGFDLTAEEAMGDSGEHEGDRPGWFFVIKERPGEPRFGFDVSRDPGEAIETFNDLAWDDAVPGVQPGAFVPAGNLATLQLQTPGAGEEEKTEQHGEDVKVAPASASSARWATLLFQAPAMVAVHAAEMLRRP